LTETFSEQLAAIKKRASNLYFDSDRFQANKDFNWLFEQAERVQELEKFKSMIKTLYKYIHLSAKKSVEENKKLQEENKRLREAIELTSDELSYAKITGNDDARHVYIENSIRFLDEALEGEE